jgi:hypothetical protein
MKLARLLLAIAVLVPLLTGAKCASTGGVKEQPLPVLPATVDHVIEVPKPLPAYLTVPLPVYVRQGGTVEAHKLAERALTNTVKLANCHRAIAEKLSRGEAADAHECDAYAPDQVEVSPQP